MSFLKRVASCSLVLVVLTIVYLILIWLWLGFDHIPNKLHDVSTLRNATYDFIIVGAGTAGCVLANRLSVNPNVTVLLVEAGDIFGATSIVPLFSTAMQQTSYDWAFRTTPQKYSSHGLINNQQFLPRGRGLGGSGQINYMLHFTGIREDFERWEKLGALDWGYEQMKPYLERLGRGTEDGNQQELCLKELRGDDIFKPNQYPSMMPANDVKSESFNFCAKTASSCTSDRRPKLHITTVDPEENHLAKAFTEAPKFLGHEHNFNAARYTIRNGIRWSSYHEYLRPAFNRPNLHVLTETMVERVVFDPQKRASAIVVKMSNSNDSFEIKVTKEVILSAGAFQTPQILKLSGIGPAIELKRHRIPIIHDSPNVGQNYFDHLNLPLFVSISATASVTLNKILHPRTILDYLSTGTGVLATTAVAGIGSLRGGKFGIILFGMGSVDEQALRHVSNMRQDAFRAHFPLYYNTSQEGFLFLNTCHQPKSRGAIFLRDQRIDSHPFINPNYLKDRYDVDCMIAAIRLAARTVDSEPFRRMGAKLYWPKVRQCSNFGPFEEDFRTNRPSDRYLECILRVSALTGHHPGGTAAMGLHSEAVVDNALRVNGVTALRVVDASVFPAPVSGTPNSVVIAVAEKAADLITKCCTEN
ncbi:neither inactivation nor afterpotential protein G-like [Armigeres subalbatus]|uniref:neither inactivation nor afterpotential protein G-like n=1 Tax=Armigeres subalbatus TaxID=124917 RepID=UPI002ED54B70